jgi:8-oxo-dGTP pyrophosphatase MutT (NUDIX family)
MEIWNGYNENGELLPGKYLRGEPLPDGVYHLVCEVLVRHTDGDFLLMVRDPNKESFAGYLEASAGGAAQYGEDPITCIRRELFEETGIRETDFRLMARRVTRQHKAISYSFFVTTSAKKDSVRLQAGETVGYRWVSGEEFLSFLKSDQAIPIQRDRILEYLDKIL